MSKYTVYKLWGLFTLQEDMMSEREEADTISVYLWSTNLYESYAPYIQSRLPEVNIEFVVGNNDLDFYKFIDLILSFVIGGNPLPSGGGRSLVYLQPVNPGSQCTFV